MKKILSLIVVIIAISINVVSAQSSEIPEGATVVTITLSEETSDQAKKLKTLESAKLFKGLSRTEFHCYLTQGASLEDLQKEVSTLISGAKVAAVED